MTPIVVLPCLVIKLLLHWGLELRGPLEQFVRLTVKAITNFMQLADILDCKH